MDSSKLVSQLINTHKVASIISPLVEAVEVNKHTGSIPDLSLSNLLKTVIETGGEVYESLQDKNKDIVEMGLVPDKVFLILSKALRNSVILYNSQSLSLIKDDVIQMLDENIGFIQRYANDTESEVNPPNERSKEVKPQENIDLTGKEYALSSLSQIYMPIWLYHTNLYLSGMIDDEKLVELNNKVSSFFSSLLDRLMKRISEPQGRYSKEFKYSSMFLCSELIANVTHNFDKKLIKNKKQLDIYLDEPEVILSHLVKPVYACFVSMNSVMEETVFSER